MDDSTDIVHKSQCSIIIRYVIPGGKLVERFLGFYDVSSSRTADTLFHVGASVMSGELNCLQAKIKEVLPQAVFVHCMAHRLNLVLQQSCNSISKYRIFFATVNGLPSFFHSSAFFPQFC